eukprot:7207531-Karenia_brevis.AAC.1
MDAIRCIELRNIAWGEAQQQALAPYPRPLLIGIQSLACLVHRQDEVSGPNMAVADGFHDVVS